MYELRISVAKVQGVCTADPPMKPGDWISVDNGDIRIPQGGYICLWALQSLLPLITPKEREIVEEPTADWMWRLHHVQCPDPNGRVIFEIERTGQATRHTGQDVGGERKEAVVHSTPGARTARQATGRLRDLRVVVQKVEGTCTSGMREGDYFILRGGRLYIPADRHFCLYALHAVIPLLPAKQRPLEVGDWLKDDSTVICPDPSGNVTMRIEPCT
jgi:uncharacterized repeat protein (TIGR04076 family)